MCENEFVIILEYGRHLWVLGIKHDGSNVPDLLW